MSEQWTVGILAATVEGDVTLRMTTEQAEQLRDQLAWLVEEDA